MWHFGWFSSNEKKSKTWDFVICFAFLINCYFKSRRLADESLWAALFKVDESLTGKRAWGEILGLAKKPQSQ